MIYRTYLPFKSAREYVDRGMAKWMGFFISEHTTALNSQGDTIDFSDALSEEEKYLYLNQVWFGKYPILLYTNLQREPYIGNIHEIQDQTIYFNDGKHLLSLNVSQVIKLSLAEEVDYEPN